MSTNLYEGEQVQVTRFACGECRTKGPCFQITALWPGKGDLVVVHRSEAREVVKAILKDMFCDEKAIDALLSQDKQ